ncbi:MAG: UDP-N-acetylmuramate:L-alanyl-gamma-D-glutamyl-meso-diaminopimelate ligase [Methylococcales bacterium]|jgi:UDP-N-acetylmuramate: L-alanyl-gamma-D-glutamyl-meso-diaminopimelate ligase|nr:UDP-N-acetylmuramate:L-alanyl-gamma-D-glutamyl-meso-diaminopimelate ligase [Methylococcales bacterium]MBT7445195.1 UDP-N-acetylmuramate:L-alanyl-gamma-D-glutamyl-meso-diaminopimelate ligase [Methylococcales bacterium]
MHIHILGICGTFMGGIALLARGLGHQVTGSDQNVYPPMSTQLEEAGIELYEGFDPAQLDPKPDVVVVGNVMSRGNPAIEAVLDQQLRYISGPQWLSENLLNQRWVIAASGTHGKTTTASMVAWILEAAGLNPGFLIGGIPENFGMSARLGETFFVVEADEYDTAFFDKRSKFVHYHPKTLIANNLEFDHADIFPDLAAIQRQFHHLMRVVPSSGLVVAPEEDENLKEVFEMGLWTPLELTGDAGVGDWQVKAKAEDFSVFSVSYQGQELGDVDWACTGRHNMFNGVAAIAACQHAGVDARAAIAYLAQFKNVKRRMEVKGVVNDITVYDDFAHHPTAIATTIQGLRGRVKDKRIIAVLEPRSNTMKMGIHAETLPKSLQQADTVYLYQPDNLGWDLSAVASAIGPQAIVFNDFDALLQATVDKAEQGDHILIMSNGGFGGIHDQVVSGLKQRYA